jgi:hypothetical protein
LGGSKLWFFPPFLITRWALGRDHTRFHVPQVERLVDAAQPKAHRVTAYVFAAQPQAHVYQGHLFMAKLATTTVFTNAKPEKETKLDKTTRAVKAMAEEETEERHVKTARLRKARLEKN